MGNCCDSPNASDSRIIACPRCDEIGRPVADETIRAILKPDIAKSLLGVERRFCKTTTCEVLYYGADGSDVLKGAAIVRVGIKETEDPVPLCYCFGFTRSDVRAEIERTGDSTLPDRITAEIQAGRCACEVKNPSGACCLGEIRKAVADAKDHGRAALKPNNRRK